MKKIVSILVFALCVSSTWAACVITTNTVSTTTYCAGSPITVAFTQTADNQEVCAFSGDGILVYLSDENGSFTNEVLIGQGPGSPVTCQIPITTLAGTGYRLKCTLSGWVTVSGTQDITVVNDPLPTIVRSSDITVCNGTSASLSIGTTTDNNTYSWSPRTYSLTTMGTALILSGTPEKVVNEIYITAQLGFCSIIDTVTIAAPLAPNITTSPSGITTTVAGTPVVLTASGALTYVWSPSSNLTASTGTSVTFASSVVGTSSITVTGTDANECVGTKIITITVTSASSGIYENDKIEGALEVYPNPYKGTTNIVLQNKNTGNVKLEVINLLGQQVYTILNEKLNAGEHRFDFSTNQMGLTDGVYFIKASYNNTFSVIRVVEMQ